MVLNKNEFGILVKAYRKQRGWTQGQLAERWNCTSAYVSQVETGKRRLDSVAQVVRLADVLDIPQEKLDAIGRGIPVRQNKAQSLAEADEAILGMLLAPGRDMVKLAWIVWLADQGPTLEDHVQDLILKLDTALTAYRGSLVKPAQQLLAYARQMQGKMAFDRLDYAAAGGHFSEMVDLGQELNDPDISALGMIHQGDVLRKRGRYETALRYFEKAQPFAETASPGIQGLRLMLTARAHYLAGDEQQFLKTINPALEMAVNTKSTVDTLANQFTLQAVLEEQAAGLTMLWKAEQALGVYKDIDRMNIYRQLRDQGSYTVDKARAYLYLGDIQRGTKLAVRGLRLASQYRSKRHIARLDATYNRLRVSDIGKDQDLQPFREALEEAQQQQKDW
jgi:transcriptional regulator with XRE-family HTH domain